MLLSPRRLWLCYLLYLLGDGQAGNVRYWETGSDWNGQPEESAPLGEGWASDASLLHLCVQTACVNPATRDDCFPQRPRVSILNDGISLKIYFKSLWKPEENQSISCWEGQLSWTVITWPLWSPLARRAVYDYRTTLDFFDNYKKYASHLNRIYVKMVGALDMTSWGKCC